MKLSIQQLDSILDEDSFEDSDLSRSAIPRKELKKQSLKMKDETFNGKHRSNIKRAEHRHSDERIFY